MVVAMEQKMRGAPADEKPKSPIHKAINKEQPHNAVEAALQPEGVEVPKHDEPAHKVAIVTGASSGIGKAIALHLASNNYNVVLVARKKEGLHEVEQELAKYKVKTLVRECDVTKVVQVHETVQHTIKMFGRIDVLVNCAGYGVYGPLETMRLEDINGQMLTNYFGSVLFIKETLTKLKESKGVIVNIASMAGLTGLPNMAAYSASKHAVVGLSDSLRYELDGTGVAVCVVAPSKVKTNIFQHESFKNVDWAQDDSGIVPSAVAREVDKAIKERKFMYVVPSRYRFAMFLKGILPDSFMKKRMKDI
jgi:short-subunit dehydrogenase